VRLPAHSLPVRLPAPVAGPPPVPRLQPRRTAGPPAAGAPVPRHRRGPRPSAAGAFGSGGGGAKRTMLPMPPPEAGVRDVSRPEARRSR
jgi:hypothetical protein